MLQGILILLGGLVAASGWFFAWRSRGEANTSGDRARLAEARADAAAAKEMDAESGQAAAETKLKMAMIEVGTLRADLVAEQKTKEDLLERLAKLGAPVGDVLLDSTIKRLYENSHREGNDPGAGGGGGTTAVPGVAAKPANRTDPR